MIFNLMTQEQIDKLNTELEQTNANLEQTNSEVDEINNNLSSSFTTLATGVTYAKCGKVRMLHLEAVNISNLSSCTIPVDGRTSRIIRGFGYLITPKNDHNYNALIVITATGEIRIYSTETFGGVYSQCAAGTVNGQVVWIV